MYLLQGNSCNALQSFSQMQEAARLACPFQMEGREDKTGKLSVSLIGVKSSNAIYV